MSLAILASLPIVLLELKRAKMDRGFTYEELRTQIEDAIQELIDDGAWSGFLEFACNFATYSPRNTILIYNQCKRRGIVPSYVAGYHRWRQLGRWVKRGERGVRIVVPVLSRRPSERIAVETTHVAEEISVVGFKNAYVFDLSQTEGDELVVPLSPVSLSGSGNDEVEKYLKTQLDSRGFQVVLNDLERGVNGFTDFSQMVVAISNSLSDRQRLKTLSHEYAHAVLHETKVIDRELAELQAETFAYLMMTSLGMETAQYSIPYILRWANGSPDRALDGFEIAYELFIDVHSALVATCSALGCSHVALHDVVA